MKMSSTETTESIEQKNEKHCWTRYSESKLIDLEKKILNGNIIVNFTFLTTYLIIV